MTYQKALELVGKMYTRNVSETVPRKTYDGFILEGKSSGGNTHTKPVTLYEVYSVDVLHQLVMFTTSTGDMISHKKVILKSDLAKKEKRQKEKEEIEECFRRG